MRLLIVTKGNGSVPSLTGHGVDHSPRLRERKGIGRPKVGEGDTLSSGKGEPERR